jgi:hypothetical protein
MTALQEFERAKRKMTHWRIRHDQALKRLRRECAHPEILEHDHDFQPSRSGFFSAIPPGRVCMRCGLHEKAWPTGLSAPCAGPQS